MGSYWGRSKSKHWQVADSLFFKDGENKLYKDFSHKKVNHYFSLKTSTFLLNHSLWFWQLIGNFIGKCQSVSIVHKTRSVCGFLPVCVSKGRLPLNQELKDSQHTAALPQGYCGTPLAEQPYMPWGTWSCVRSPWCPGHLGCSEAPLACPHLHPMWGRENMAFPGAFSFTG